ncbi:hypothetical protein [Nitrosomonas sp.]|uniref:hypothetical protein n=1 Tax=Nitrosomonas sp. TaxID=42353 RepID=UPI0025D20B52|nr:hypothetical protein [Nitrosomonas sp.]
MERKIEKIIISAINIMKQAILQIFRPEKDSQGSIPHEASLALDEISRIYRERCKNLSNTGENLEALGENCWLLDLGTEVHTLSLLVTLAERRCLSYRIAFLDEKLDWIPYGKK